MCGRYYLDSDYIDGLQEKANFIYKETDNEVSGEIFPTNKAPIITGQKNNLSLEFFTWGLPKYNSKGVIINARSETVKEKKMFSEGIIKRRCIIPANGFYEWDSSKNKIMFTMKENTIMFMAGLYNTYDGKNRFAILTTNANASIIDVHNRMPLILEIKDLKTWIFDLYGIDNIINKTPPLLDRRSDSFQLKLDI